MKKWINIEAALILGIIGIFLALIGGWWLSGRLTSYLNWRSLTKDDLISSANNYVNHRFPGNKACLYAVICKENRAGLELVKDLEAFDFKRAKKLVWDRRFKNVCIGQTANFGIELLPETLTQEADHVELRRGVWSFYGNGFYPRGSRFYTSAFSASPYEPCTAEYVIAD